MTKSKLLPLADVAKLPTLPRRRRGGRLHYSTLYRWAAKGLNGVRLRTVRCGGTRCTTTEWLHEFFERLDEDAASGDGDAVRPHVEVGTDDDAVEQALDALGVTASSKSPR